MFAAAEEPKELVLVDSSFHSSELVTYAPAAIVRETRAAVFRFLSENSRMCQTSDDHAKSCEPEGPRDVSSTGDHEHGTWRTSTTTKSPWLSQKSLP
jgi:hypothetical protein